MSEPIATPIRKRTNLLRSRPIWVLVGVLVLVAILTAAAAASYLLGRDRLDDSAATSAATITLSGAAETVIDQINADDKSVSGNLCGESFQSATLGEPIIGVDGIAARQLEAEEFTLGSIMGNYGSVFSRLRVTLDGHQSTHAAMYVLSREDGRWKLCSVALLVPQGEE